MSNPEKILIQIHPRAFSAFGEDLVTNDLVAITELVKNSYDAFAFNVKIIFGTDKGEKFIRIEDDGLGMNRKTILNAWATIATPYKKKNPIVKRVIDDKVKIRKVSGNKGLGRFSAARLGNQMFMKTKSDKDECLEAFFDWKTFNDIEDISDCFMSLQSVENNAFETTGTSITIKELKEEWNEERIIELSEELSRLISPFNQINDFSISIIDYDSNYSVDVQPQEFINNPVYKIEGNIDESGRIFWWYVFDNGKGIRKKEGTVTWEIDNYKDEYFKNSESRIPQYTCGKFKFEIRAWDLDADSIQNVASRFDIGKREIRDNIRLYKGISIYRDNVLVLPKSETTRDWLGLDAKRISQIGRRLSTGQIVGIVNITNEDNPDIRDTTDREKLVDTNEYKQFINILNCVIAVFQRERLNDRVEGKKKESLTDIIAPLSAKPLVDKIETAIKEGKDSDVIFNYVKDYEKSNSKQLNELNDRLIYYAQTASLGSIAIVIMHEFLTGLTSIKRFLNKVKNYNQKFDVRTNEYYEDAIKSHKRIIDVTRSFSPLYRQDLRKKQNQCNLLDAINCSIRLIKAKKISKNVKFEINIYKEYEVMISDGELQTIFINLFDNACYWMKDTDDNKKLIRINIENSGDANRLEISVSDTGYGVSEDDVEKIFIPGVTSKPKGIGMGLVIVTELLNYYQGKIGVRLPSDLCGATFVFDIPIRKG